MTIHIGRREFISTLVGGAAAASPIVACADSGKVARIGYLSPDSPSPAATALFDAFCDGLRELGWIKGKNVTVELRYAENRVERLPEVAAELVRINVDVIVDAERLDLSQPSGPPRPFQSSWPPPATRWGAGLSPVWRDQAVTSRA
jgi:hypothetical protein